MAEKRFTLRKHQILRSKKEIAELFEKGQSVIEYPIKGVYLFKSKSEFSDNEKIDRFRVMFVVPKKSIKKSSHRNRIKRLMRESFRLSQHELLIPDNNILIASFIYLSKNKEEASFFKIKTHFHALIREINNKLSLK
ncbi:MAG: ribonuclease P protein component [Bacteroidia bacterium]|nr:MAG: ribonuclease P protein component [Bacteroidia bacterium]